MNDHYTGAVAGNAVDAANTRAFLQQAVDHCPRLVAFSFTLVLPHRETLADYRSLILRFHTEVWLRTGAYSQERQQARKNSPPTVGQNSIGIDTIPLRRRYPNSHQAFSGVCAVDIIPTMKKTNDTALPPEESLADLAHFAWCALVGLRLAQQDGQALSPLTTHTFLLRWLAAAQKQRRLPRSVAPDIDSLLRLGRQKGLAADLQKRLEYLLDSCSNPVSQQSDLFRLTHAIEHLKSQGWVNAVVAEGEWVPGALYAEYANTSALLVRKSELQRHFTEQGRQSAPVDFMVVGDGRTVAEVLDARALRYVIREPRAGGCILSLLPSADVFGDAVAASDAQRPMKAR